MIRQLSVPIAVFWLALAAVTNVFVPQLETVAKAHNVSLSPQDAPSLQASKRIGKVFHEFDSDSAAMIVLEGDQPLGADAHHYYDGLIRKLSQDTKHVEHIQDFWGDPLTAAGSQSTDGKAALVQVYLAGNQGESLSNQSVDSVRDIVDHTPPPPGVKAYVTGAAPLVTDQFEVGSKGTLKVTLITIAVILMMLFFNYRSVTDHLVGDHGGDPRRRRRCRQQFTVTECFGPMQCTPGFFDLLVAGFLGRVGHHAGRVVVAGAVGVVGVEIDMDTGVAVVVLLAPAVRPSGSGSGRRAGRGG